MKIKNQEKIMGAVKAVLVAEDTQAAVKRPNKRTSVKTGAALLVAAANASDAVKAARAELRKIHTEIVHDEYGQ